MKLYILAGTAGITSCFCNLRTEIQTIAGINEFYCNMSVLAEAEKGTLEAKDRETKKQQQHKNSRQLL
ncbi:MAG: hypothetical protein C0402_16275 [Thermodesulfovibrio sp.]|nr:hypothetical protein [Thermodesulfovibrio sp.]